MIGAEPLLAPGAAGWLTAVTSVGMLGPVLYWLMMRHLPAKDKLMLDLFDQHLKHVKELRGEQEQKVLAVITALKDEAREDRAERERQTVRLIEAIKAEATRLIRAVGAEERA